MSPEQWKLTAAAVHLQVKKRSGAERGGAGRGGVWRSKVWRLVEGRQALYALPVPSSRSPLLETARLRVYR